MIDMIPFFIEANPYTRGIVPNIEALASTVNDTGGTVAWVVPTDDPLPAARSEFFGPATAETYRRSSGTGPLRGRVGPPLTVRPHDLVVAKSSPSAFFPGHCDLHHRLHERGVDTVVITGTVANVCCESSARDASTLGYRTLFVADATSATTDAELNATLHTLYRSFTDVRSTRDVIDLLRGEAPLRP